LKKEKEELPFLRPRIATKQSLSSKEHIELPPFMR